MGRQLLTSLINFVHFIIATFSNLPLLLILMKTLGSIILAPI